MFEVQQPRCLAADMGHALSDERCRDSWGSLKESSKKEFSVFNGWVAV